MVFAKNITIIIPTLNRSDFILKMLRAFNATNFSGKIIIGDSSDDFHYKKTNEFIRANAHKYEINQYPLPGLKAYECIVNLYNKVETPFVLWMCDDDILVPGTLDKAEKYLNENREYSAVGGVAIVLGIDEENYDTVIGSDRYWLQSIEDNSATNRLLELGKNYQVISYSLCRTEQFAKKFRSYVNSGISDVSIGIELLPTLMLAVHGKVKFLDELFVVRQIHARRYPLPTTYDWITRPGWLQSQNFLIDTISDELVQVEKINKNEAEIIVKKAFYFYLQSCMCNSAESIEKIRTNILQLIIKELKKYPKIYTFLKIQKLKLFGCKNPYSLNSLLNPKSIFYNDFYPIYKSIITSTEKNNI